uniref:Integrase catalytic domain-containing protein n=1 Tax=Latimeria chalumnae TaxID=7897 RepID=H3ATK4_LATCH
VKGCGVYMRVRNMPSVAPLYPWKWPTQIWQQIHIDFAEQDKHYFFVVVDSHSKWLEVILMSTITTAKTIEVLQNLFASYGLPEEVVTNNGPQFTSVEFQQFLNFNGIKHTRVSPYHPASNGAAERCVQTLKKAFTKQTLSIWK